MSIISLKTIPVAKNYKFAKLSLDTSVLEEQIKTADENTRKVVKSEKVLGKMANFVIVTAAQAEIIPENYVYYIRLPKKGRVRRDSAGNVILKKSGKNKGKPVIERTPAQYFRTVRTNDSKYMYEPVIEKPKKSKVTSIERSTTRTVRTVKLKSGRRIAITKAKVEEKSHSVTRTITHGVEKVIGYERKKGASRKREHWTEAKGAYAEYNKEFAYDDRNRPYADRPPHLVDIDTTHLTKFTKNGVQIVVTNKKPKDKRFYEEGGVQYGSIQYYGGTDGDINWKRASDTTTSRWLEVAIGLPVPSNIKGYSVYSLATAQKNYDNMLEIMAEAIRKGIRKK